MDGYTLVREQPFDPRNACVALSTLCVHHNSIVCAMRSSNVHIDTMRYGPDTVRPRDIEALQPFFAQISAALVEFSQHDLVVFLSYDISAAK